MNGAEGCGRASEFGRQMRRLAESASAVSYGEAIRMSAWLASIATALLSDTRQHAVHEFVVHEHARSDQLLDQWASTLDLP